MKLPIYLDYSATTPVDPRVAAKLIPYLTEQFGNPASRSHSFGWDAEKAVEEAREQVAALVNADAKEIVLPGVKRWLQSQGHGQFSDRSLAEAMAPQDLPPEIHEVTRLLAQFAGVALPTALAQ